MALLKGKCPLHVNLPAGRLYKPRHLNPAGAHLNCRLIPECSFSSTPEAREQTQMTSLLSGCVPLSYFQLTEITKEEKEGRNKPGLA